MSSRKRKRRSGDLPPPRDPEQSADAGDLPPPRDPEQSADAELIKKYAAASSRVEIVPRTWRRVVRGRRSKCDAKEWVCPAVHKYSGDVCKYVNRAVRHTFFDLPRFRCTKCKRRLPVGYEFKFSLANIEVNGACPVGNVKSQGKRPHCGLYCACSGAEICSRIRSMLLGREVMRREPIICMDTFFQKLKVKLKLPKRFILEYTSPGEIPLTVYDYIDILINQGVRTKDGLHEVQISSWKHIPIDFQEICEELAEGNPLWTYIYTGKGFHDLKPNEIYVPPKPEQIVDGKSTGAHAILLIGGGMTKQGVKFYRFLNSHDEGFCRLTSKRKDGIGGGFANVIADGIRCTPIKFFREKIKEISGTAKLSEPMKHGKSTNTTRLNARAVEDTHGSTAESAQQLNSQILLPHATLSEISPEAMEVITKLTGTNDNAGFVEFSMKQPASEAQTHLVENIDCALISAYECTELLPPVNHV